ncbi:MAG: cation:proton antiporter, partial [Deferrisomatales bacterium]
VAVSLADAAARPAGGLDLWLGVRVLGEVAASVGVGVLVGRGGAFYVQRVGKALPVLLVVLAFLVAEGSRWGGHAIEARYGVAFHLEPLLVAIAAGFVVQNFTPAGKALVETLEALAAPIFVVFFSMAGVTLELSALAAAWAAALVFLVVRNGLVSGAGFLGSVAAGESRRFGALAGLGFYAQAGISLGLAQEVGRRFPGWGAEVASFLVACIALNQMFGPIAFKVALDRMGESRPARPTGEPAAGPLRS